MSKQGSRWVDLLKHAAVAVGYALGFMLLREVSFSHWVLFGGLRFCALLLAPYKYWPALVLGELGPAAYTSFSCIETYGVAWSVLAAFPPIALGAPLVFWGRKSLHILPRRGSVNIRSLLLATLAVAAIWSLFNLAVLSLAVLPPNSPALAYPSILGRWFVGNFLGVLTVAPLVLCVRELVAKYGGVRPASMALLSQKSLGSAAGVFACLAALVLIGHLASSDSLRQSARMAMFLPVVWLAMRYGWHGAAVGGTLASIAVVATMPAIADTDTMQAQVFIAFAITTMLLLGERIASLDYSGRQEKVDLQNAMVLAQRNMFLGELHLRQTSEALEHVREAVQGTYGQLLTRLQHLLPDHDERDYRKRVAVTQQQLFRLADSLNPVVWRANGLAAALRQGAIARVMAESDVAYWCTIRERGLEGISDTLSIGVYRLICDTIVELCHEGPISSVSIALRVGAGKTGKRWLMISATAFRQGAAKVIHSTDLAMRLSSSGLGIEAVQDRVSTFAGQMKYRRRENRTRISMIMHDPQP